MKSNSLTDDRVLFRARIPVARECLDALMEAMAVLEPPPDSWEDMETGDAWVETFDADRTALHERARRMEKIVEEVEGHFHCADFGEIEPADWRDAWKKFFHTSRVSDRILIHPSWEPISPLQGDVVVHIDPGMSFGTGLHPTTRSCLVLLDRLSGRDPAGCASMDVLDLGCGSGILAIAALKLGFPKVTSMDYDPIAVRTARENLEINGVGGANAPCETGDVLTDLLPSAHLVIANILAPVLEAAAPRIAAAVLPGASTALILSGILDSQFAEVTAAYAAAGFESTETVVDGEWRTGLFRRVG